MEMERYVNPINSEYLVSVLIMETVEPELRNIGLGRNGADIMAIMNLK